MSKNSAKSSASCNDLYDLSGKKVELSEMGFSAKKAETSLADCCRDALGELGQAGSVAVGCGAVGAPHFEEEDLHKGKVKNCDDENCDDPRCGEHVAAGKAKECEDEEKGGTDGGNEKRGSGRTLPIDLSVAGGLALLAVEKAGQVVHQVAEDWEGKIDSVAEKAHATIESAQKVMKHPVGETMRKVDQLKQPKKNRKKAS